MKSLESFKAIADATEVTLEPGDWGGQVFDNLELGCFEAVFVIELDGIGLSASGKGMVVSTSNYDSKNEPSFLERREVTL